MSPLLAFDCLRTITWSPSRIPALIILSPRIVNINKAFSSVRKSGGNGKKSDASSTAKIGSPAVTTPNIGIVVG